MELVCSKLYFAPIFDNDIITDNEDTNDYSVTHLAPYFEK